MVGVCAVCRKLGAITRHHATRQLVVAICRPCHDVIHRYQDLLKKLEPKH